MWGKKKDKCVRSYDVKVHTEGERRECVYAPTMHKEKEYVACVQAERDCRRSLM